MTIRTITASLVATLCLATPCSAAVVGWGANEHSELASGSRSARQNPVTATGLPAGVKQVVSTYFSSYALLSDGTVMAWGDNSHGQLGDGTRATRALPVAVKGLSGVSEIAAGGPHALALLGDGTVVAWGDNTYGELGNGTGAQGDEAQAASSLVPRRVPGLAGVVQVAAGGGVDAALLANGTVLAWGENKQGQLGDGTTVEKDVPTPVRRLSGVRQVAVGGTASSGGHLLALLGDRTVMAVGGNESGQLGNGTKDSSTPVPVKGLGGVSAVSAGTSHNVALLEDGTVAVWGSNNMGELGVGPAPESCATGPCSRSPVPLGLHDVSAVSAGLHYSLALSSGKSLAWGWNSKRQLGDGTTTNRPAPVPVLELGGATAISAGEHHSLAIVAGAGPAPAPEATPETPPEAEAPTVDWGIVPVAAGVAGWGENFHGELGAGFKSATQGATPAKLPSGVKEVSAAVASNLALMDDGTVFAWGSNQINQLGIGAPSVAALTPVPVPSLKGVRQVAISGSHAMALLADGTVQVWGSNLFGELGNGTTTHGHEMKGDNAPRPQPVPGLHGVVQIAAGGPDDVALLANGTVMAWGENHTGQLGPGGLEKTVPTLVPGLSNVKAVAVGAFPFAGGHMLALLNNGTVMSVGRNDQGQLGNGGTTNSSLPVPVKGLSGVVAVSADVSHSLALTENGTVYAWGGNDYGQLGTGVSRERCANTGCSRLPVALPLHNVTSISAGFRFSVALSGGKPFTWGWNVKGELGDGTRIQRSTPVPVPGIQEATAVSAGWYHVLTIVTGGMPPTPIEAVPGARSLTVRWRAPTETHPWRVSYRPITFPRSSWSHGVVLPPGARSYTVTGLVPVPYQVSVQEETFRPRVVQAVPLL